MAGWEAVAGTNCKPYYVTRKIKHGNCQGLYIIINYINYTWKHLQYIIQNYANE